MKIWKRDIDLNILNDRGKSTLADHFGIVFFEVGDKHLSARMLIEERHKQPIGIMHGGVSCVLAETVASTAANFCVDREHYCVGLDINTNHIGPVREGEIVAKAKPFHIGRSTQVWGINIKTSEGKLVSVNRLTLSVLRRQ